MPLGLIGHNIQNSIISLLAESLRWKIREKLHTARYFTIIADKTKDISKSEQLSLVLGYVFNGNTHERFISNTNCAELNAEAIILTSITSALRETDADITNCVSQCYDGASVMSGYLTGVRTRVTDVNPSAIHIHCHAHQLNLDLVDTCHTVPHASNFSLLERVFFSLLEKELGLTREIQLKKLSDTRWSCRHSSINAIMTTIQPLLHTLKEISESHNACSIEARGLLFQVESFPFFLSLVLFDRVFAITNNLCNLLQSEQISYSAAASCIKATRTTLINLKSEEEWSKIWLKAIALAGRCGVTVASLRSRRHCR